MRETIFPYFIIVPKITNSVIKIKIFPHGGISKYFFLDHFSPSFLGQNGIFDYRIHFEGINDVWISQVRRVKTLCLPGLMYFSFTVICLLKRVKNTLIHAKTTHIINKMITKIRNMYLGMYLKKYTPNW